jgi:hypothetical protein
MRSSIASGGIGAFTEDRAWVEAQRLVANAHTDRTVIPIVLAPAEETKHLAALGILTNITIAGRTTRYEFAKLQMVTERHLKTSLTMVKGGRISPNYIRSYILCETPAWVMAALTQPNQLQHEMEPPEFDPNTIRDERAKTQREVICRQGQERFRSELLEAYGYRCAISGCDVQAVLDAAHIIPYSGASANHCCNGLLLRTDLHTLFDLNFIKIDPDDMHVDVAESLRRSDYGKLHGTKLRLPSDISRHPSRKALHRRVRALGDYETKQ